MNKSQIATPALILDIGALRNNIRMMSEYLDNRNVSLRPHVKVHKTPEIAKMQIDSGAHGIMVAKLGEAEVMINAGIDDIAIANEIVQDRKIEKFLDLSSSAKMTMAVDNPLIVEKVSKIAIEKKKEANLIVDINVGMDRCGVLPGRPGSRPSCAARCRPDRTLRRSLIFSTASDQRSTDPSLTYRKDPPRDPCRPTPRLSCPSPSAQA